MIHRHPPILSLEALRAIVSAPYLEREAGIESNTFAMQMSGFGLWLASQADDFIDIHARKALSAANLPAGPIAPPLPALFEGREGVHTYGLAHPNGLAVLMADPSQPADQQMIRLGIRWWGDDSPARRLLGALRAWTKAGQPDARRLHVSAYPNNAPPERLPLRQRVRLEKRFFTYALHWG